MLYSSISQKKGSDIIRVGVVVKNDNNEILLVEDEINRINKQIYNIPFVDVKEFNETEIINELNNKYGFKVEKLESYINETNFLNEMCDEKLQVNMACKAKNINMKNASWNVPADILDSIDVPSSVKQCIEVYSYNQNLN